MNIDREMKAIVAGITLASFAAGSAGTYFVMNKQINAKLQTHYDARLKKELEDTKKFYERVHKTGGFSDPEELAKEILPEDSVIAKVTKPEEIDPEMEKALESLKSYASGADAQKTTLELHNIFRDAERVVHEIEDEEVNDDPTVPYIISKEVYLTGEKEYDQSTYTYYVEDGVLVDEADQVVEDEDKLIGEGNLQRFGYKSGDNNMVYVRNDRLEMDFEIMKSRGSYAAEVLGFTHSERRPGQRKFRGDFE